MDQDGIVAIGLLTQRDLTLLGPTFTRVWPVEEFRAGTSADEPMFQELLKAIDRADEQRQGAPASEPGG